jgi:hypothetical protein
VKESAPPISKILLSKEEKKLEERRSKKQKRNKSKKLAHPKISFHKKLKAEQLINFSSFRRHFYQLTHHLIKSAFDNSTYIKIHNIRLAPINESVQNYFMKTLINYSHFPELVYHGTEMNSIQSILRYGLLVPCQHYPITPEAPVIISKVGQAFGRGIYCSQNVFQSFAYNRYTNTLLVCAALPKRRKGGIIDGCHGDILVLKEESRIIPLFLLDLKYLKQIYTNYPWFESLDKK